MNNFMDKKIKIVNLKYLSRNEIVKKVNNIKSIKNKINKINTKHLIKRNKEKTNIFTPEGNITYSNFHNYIKFKKNSKRNLKNDLLIDSDYSSFISKNSRFNSDFSKLEFVLIFSLILVLSLVSS